MHTTVLIVVLITILFYTQCCSLTSTLYELTQEWQAMSIPFKILTSGGITMAALICYSALPHVYRFYQHPTQHKARYLMRHGLTSLLLYGVPYSALYSICLMKD